MSSADQYQVQTSDPCANTQFLCLSCRASYVIRDLFFSGPLSLSPPFLFCYQIQSDRLSEHQSKIRTQSAAITTYLCTLCQRDGDDRRAAFQLECLKESERDGLISGLSNRSDSKICLNKQACKQRSTPTGFSF